MTADRIAAVAAAGESETLEFKSTTGTRREAVRTVCAMLNQQGGRVLFGVTPEGNAIGQQVSERTIEEVSAEIGRIEPPAFPTVERVQVAEDREVVVVSVTQGPVKPYQYRGTAYRRVGNTTPRWVSTSTIVCSSSACTANGAGRTNPRPSGRSRIWTWWKSATPLPRRCGSAG